MKEEEERGAVTVLLMFSHRSCRTVPLFISATSLNTLRSAARPFPSPLPALSVPPPGPPFLHNLFIPECHITFAERLGGPESSRSEGLRRDYPAAHSDLSNPLI